MNCICTSIYAAYKNCRYGFMEPDGNVQNLERHVMEKYLPKGIDIDYEHDFYVFMPSNWNVTDADLERACFTIIEKNVHFAAINLNQEFGLFGIMRNSCKNAKTMLLDLLQDQRCRLKYLDISNSGLGLEDAMVLIESLPYNSTLKCIRIGGSCYTEYNHMLKFSDWLINKRPHVAIIGTHSGMDGGIDSYSHFKKCWPTEGAKIESYYETHFGDLKITDLPNSFYKYESRSTTYH